MNKSSKPYIKNVFFVCVMLVFFVLCIIYPKQTFNAFLNGAQTCYYTVIPSIFPLLVASNLVFLNPVSKYLGILFVPFLKLLGIKSKPAATAVLFAFIGGFAVFCNNINKCLETKNITPVQAELLLCVGLNTGPAFVVATVGGMLLNNTIVGIYIYISLFVSSLISTIITKIIMKKTSKDTILYDNQFLYPSIDKAFVASIKTSTQSCILMCGYIIFFNILFSLFSCQLNQCSKLFIAFFLEVTLACKYSVLTNSEYKIIFIIVALCILGLSIIAQSKSLLNHHLSFKMFFVSRIFHIPISIATYLCICKLFPISSAVVISTVKPLRFTPSVSLVMVLMVTAMLYECYNLCKNANLKQKMTNELFTNPNK